MDFRLEALERFSDWKGKISDLTGQKSPSIMSSPLVAVENDKGMAEESHASLKMRGFDTAVKSIVNLAIADTIFRWNEFLVSGRFSALE